MSQPQPVNNHPRANQQIVTCENCGSNIVAPSMGKVTLGVLLLLSTTILVWIPILGWIATPFALIGGIFFIVLGITKPRNFNCQSCNHSFTVDKDRYKKWKALAK